MTPEEVCDLLQVTKKTLYRWAHETRHGTPTGPEVIKVGGSNRYDPRAVRAYMKQQTL